MDKDIKIGVIFAILSNFLGGLQPVVANARPLALDSYIFAGMSSLFQFIFFIPVFFIERWRMRKKLSEVQPEGISTLEKPKYYFGRSKWKLFLVIGITFALVYFLYYEGLRLAGSINGTLALKTTTIFGVIFGFLLLKERVTKLQVVFSIILFFGMTLAITQGALNVLEVNLGVLLVLICAIIWMLGHTCSKPYLSNDLITSSELLIARNLITAIVLIGSYLILFGEQIAIILVPSHAFFYIIMGLIYGSNLFCWYQIIKHLNISIASIVISPQIIITSLLGTIWLGEPFTIYHLVGLIIIIGCIIGINWQSKKNSK